MAGKFIMGVCSNHELSPRKLTDIKSNLSISSKNNFLDFHTRSSRPALHITAMDHRIKKVEVQIKRIFGSIANLNLRQVEEMREGSEIS